VGKDTASIIGNVRSERIFAFFPEHKGSAFVPKLAVQNVSRLDSFAVLRYRPHDIVTVELLQGEGEDSRFIRMCGFRQVKAQVDDRIHCNLLGQHFFFSSGVLGCGCKGILSILLELDGASLQAEGSGDSVHQLDRLLGAVHSSFGQRPGEAIHVFPHRHHLNFAIGVSRFMKVKSHLRGRIV